MLDVITTLGFSILTENQVEIIRVVCFHFKWGGSLGIVIGTLQTC